MENIKKNGIILLKIVSIVILLFFIYKNIEFSGIIKNENKEETKEELVNTIKETETETSDIDRYIYNKEAKVSKLYLVIFFDIAVDIFIIVILILSFTKYNEKANKYLKICIVLFLITMILPIESEFSESNIGLHFGFKPFIMKLINK
ncbi:MAG: hypothetical protein IKD74_02600 [Clostridia bacterium]|nr:hypothetical protein [Clostridia bacterium]